MVPGSDSSTVDALHRSLQQPVRRAVLAYLDVHGTATLDELAKHVAGRTDDDVDRLRIVLHHVHLPKLAALDGVDFDHRSGAVRYRESTATSRLLEQVRERGRA
jgi:hypothetical protein